jgi:hypothetical protein
MSSINPQSACVLCVVCCAWGRLLSCIFLWLVHRTVDSYNSNALVQLCFAAAPSVAREQQYTADI